MDVEAEFDTWSAGEAYERYMGRWSRRIAEDFVRWLDVAPGLAWLDVGCGTGALTGAIAQITAPSSVLAVDPSADFLAFATSRVADPRVTFAQGEAERLPCESGAIDVIVSGLALNFVPDPVAALREMQRVAAPGGRIAFYVWDYPGRSPAFVDAFWQAAVGLDPDAVLLHEVRRFSMCTETRLRAILTESGLSEARLDRVEGRTDFASFEDFWEPFTLGAGPAPGYCRSLSTARQAALRDALANRFGQGGGISLPAAAWAAQAFVSAST